MNNLSPADKDLAKRFIDKQLTIEELQQVNERIKIDKEFATGLAYYTAMQKTFANRKAKQKKELIDKVVPLKKKQWKYWIPAAILVGIISTAAIIFWNDSNRTKRCQQELITLKNSIPQTTTLGATNHIDRLILQEKYEEAIIQLANQREEASDKCRNNLINYKLAMLLLYHQNGKRAKEALTPLQCLEKYYLVNYPHLPIHIKRAKNW